MPTKSITALFNSLDFPLRNSRWAWGAQNGSAIVLRTWGDEYESATRTIRILRSPAELRIDAKALGLKERIRHLQQLWSGQISGYTVMAEAKDPTAKKRAIVGFAAGVYPLEKIFTDDDGTIAAVVGTPIEPSNLKNHRQTHRTQAPGGAFPGGAA